MNKIAHIISVRNNRKIDSTEKPPKAFAFFNIFQLKFSESLYNCSGSLSMALDFLIGPLKKFGGQILNFSRQIYNFACLYQYKVHIGVKLITSHVIVKSYLHFFSLRDS